MHILFTYSQITKYAKILKRFATSPLLLSSPIPTSTLPSISSPYLHEKTDFLAKKVVFQIPYFALAPYSGKKKTLPSNDIFRSANDVYRSTTRCILHQENDIFYQEKFYNIDHIKLTSSNPHNGIFRHTKWCLLIHIIKYFWLTNLHLQTGKMKSLSQNDDFGPWK